MSELTEIMQRRNPNGPVHGWSGSNTYTINNNPDHPNPVNNGEFNVQANFPTTTYYTVQFTLRANELPNNGNSLFAPRGIAEIHWTVQGNHHQRILHVANGTTISGAGEAVWVNFVDDTILAEDVDPTILTVTGIVSIVTGTRANAAGSQPPMLVENEGRNALGAIIAIPTVLVPGGLIDIEVPRDHGVNSMLISAYRTGPGAAAALVGNELEILGTFGIFSAGAALTNIWMPIPPGESQFRLINNAIIDSISVSLLWGIEG